MSSILDRMIRASKNVNETNDCAVKAVAIVTGVDYGRAHILFSAFGRVHGKGTPFRITAQVMDELGFVAVKINNTFKSRTIRTLQAPVSLWRGPETDRKNRSQWSGRPYRSGAPGPGPASPAFPRSE